MVKIAVEDGTCTHTGTVCSGPVAGSVSPGNNLFVKIESKLIVVEADNLVVPVHNNPPCGTPISTGHTFAIDTLAQSFVTIEGYKVSLLGDGYTTDSTLINDEGSNSFVEII